MIELFFSFLMLSTQRTADDPWKQIVPLRSTRSDVERLLGPSSDSCKSMCRYETTNQVLFVRYTGEPCSKDERSRWRVPMNTVFEVRVNLGETPKLSELKLKLRDFTKTEDPELDGYLYYYNDKTGIGYAVSADGRVYSISRFPNRNDDTNFECR